MDLAFIFIYFIFIYVTKTMRKAAMNLRGNEMHGKS